MTLMTHRLQGGLGVANIKYYLATQIAQLSLLHASIAVTLWVLLELPNCAPVTMPFPPVAPHNLRPPLWSPLMLHSKRFRTLLCQPNVTHFALTSDH